MTLTLDRVEIESVGSDPIGLARALLTQLPDINGRVPVDEIALALDILRIEAVPLASRSAAGSSPVSTSSACARLRRAMRGLAFGGQG